MLVYLDSVIVIYAVEGARPFQARARAMLAALAAAGDRAAVSDLTRLECRVEPLRLGDAPLLADYETFFAAPELVWSPLASSVYERAARIRADYGFKLGDSLHLAAAVEHGCRRFSTNDMRLGGFPDVIVEVLP
jgi:predicted nucleic acid-binding protein